MGKIKARLIKLRTDREERQRIQNVILIVLDWISIKLRIFAKEAVSK